MAQILVPVADQAVGSWSTAPLWSKVDDDSTVNPTGDGTTIQSEGVGNNTQTTFADFQLASGSTPQAGSHVLRARWNHNQSGRTMRATCELWQGVPGSGTLVATLQVDPDVGTTETESTYTLTSGEVSNISDYSALYVRLHGFGTGGGPSRNLIVDLVELEIPDAGASPVVVQASPATMSAGAQATTPNLAALAVQAVAASMSPAAQAADPQVASGGGPPVVESTAVSLNDRFTDNDTVDLPSGLTDGDLIIIGLAYRHGTGTITWPSEWTRIGSATAHSSDGLQLDTVYAVVGSGAGEVPSSTTSITVSTVDNGGTVYLAWRISGAEDPATQAPERSSVVEDASGADADPPSLTPTGGAKDYLWLAFAADGTGTYTAGPANYSNFIQGREGGGTASDHASAGGAERQLNAASEDPGAFTDNSTVSSLACTIAVHPAAGGGITVQATPAGLTAGAQPANPALSALTIPATPATLSPAAQSVNPAPAAKAVQATPAGMTIDPQVSSPALAAQAVQAVAAVLTPNAQASNPALAALSIQASPGNLTTTAQAVDAILAALAVQASPGNLALDPQVVNPIVSGAPVTIQASPGILTLTGQPADPVLAAFAVQASPAGLQIEAQTLDPVLSALTVQVTPAGLAMVAQATDPQAGGVAVQATPANLSTVAQTVDPVLAALAVQASPAGLVVTAQVLSVAAAVEGEVPVITAVGKFVNLEAVGRFEELTASGVFVEPEGTGK